jgi:hypothetical protein
MVQVSAGAIYDPTLVPNLPARPPAPAGAGSALNAAAGADEVFTAVTAVGPCGCN